MFWPLFFSQNTIMFEKVLLFPKIPQKLSVFQDVYDNHLILGEKQWLKQIEKCSLCCRVIQTDASVGLFHI